MRRFVWKRCLVNAVPANVLWLAFLLPWSLFLIAGTYRQGHSRAVVQGVTPEMVIAREMSQRELSWARVSAVLSVLLFWVPVIGLIAGFIGYWVNRQSGVWTRRVTQATFAASALGHALLLGLFVAGF
jgi:hypothetical protein